MNRFHYDDKSWLIRIHYINDIQAKAKRVRHVIERGPYKRIHDDEFRGMESGDPVSIQLIIQ